jgi:hypothetical protein
VNGHLFGAGDPGASALRKERQEDARRRSEQRNKPKENTAKDDREDSGQ